MLNHQRVGARLVTIPQDKNRKDGTLRPICSSGRARRQADSPLQEISFSEPNAFVLAGGDANNSILLQNGGDARVGQLRMLAIKNDALGEKLILVACPDWIEPRDRKSRSAEAMLWPA